MNKGIEQFINKLKDGNAEFVKNLNENREISTKLDVSKLHTKQTPFAIVLACSDSRAPVELIFNQGLGELFVVRVAGNIAKPSQIGSIEFACQNFGCQLVVVLGHSQCGAIKASYDSVVANKANLETASISPNIKALVSEVSPIFNELDTQNKDEESILKAAITLNVENSIQQLRQQSDVLSDLATKDKIQIIGAEYEVASGKVRFYS